MEQGVHGVEGVVHRAEGGLHNAGSHGFRGREEFSGVKREFTPLNKPPRVVKCAIPGAGEGPKTLDHDPTNEYRLAATTVIWYPPPGTTAASYTPAGMARKCGTQTPPLR